MNGGAQILVYYSNVFYSTGFLHPYTHLGALQSLCPFLGSSFETWSKMGLSPKTSVPVSLLASNFLRSLQGGAYLPSERGGTGRRDHRKIWKDDLKLLTLKVWNLTSVYLSSWQLPLSYVLPGCPC